MGNQAEAAVTEQGLSFDEAVAYVKREKGAAFTFTPIFEEDDEAAAGAQLFVLVPDGNSFHLRFVAGPFYYKVYVEDEFFEPADIPEMVKTFKFRPSAYREDLFEIQLQDAIRFLMENVRD
jgi:hypothetical protein